jgi:ribosomal-protein-alanine N-acetyltransferase
MTMQLTALNVFLLPLDDSDKALFIEMAMCPNIMVHVYTPFTYQEAEEAFAEKSKPWQKTSSHWLTLSINEQETHEKLGTIGLKIIDQLKGTAEVGFMLKQSAQGKGYASCALKLLMNYAFTELNLHTLRAVCSIKNKASQTLLSRRGFQRSKVPTIENDYIYTLRKVDWHEFI